MKTLRNAEVTVGDGVVTVKRDGSSTLSLANILGTIKEGNTERIYLDRLVHNVGEQQMGDFAVSGAISTVLTRPVVQQ